MKEISSIQEVKQMLKGEHSSQTKKQFQGLPTDREVLKIKEKNKEREVGETWDEYDDSGTAICTWTQKKGYRIKTPVGFAGENQYNTWLNDYPNCTGEDCKTKIKDRLDQKYRLIYGMCTDCALNYETKLKLSGEWPEFERKKMLNNAISYFKEADVAVEEAASRLEKIEFVGEEGEIEKWESNEDGAANLKEEYNTYKNLILETLEGKRTDVYIN